MTTHSEKRKHPRYPVSDAYQRYVACRLCERDTDYTHVDVLDFSLNGLKIKSPQEKERDSIIDCIISLPELYPKELHAKLRVKHTCRSECGTKYIIGAEIVETDRDYLTRIFSKIMEFVSQRTGVVF